VNRLVESKARFWLDLDDISVAEKIAYFLSTHDTDTDIVYVCAISRFQIFAVDQGWEVMVEFIVQNRVYLRSKSVQ
jgi:hypothetical protein